MSTVWLKIYLFFLLTYCDRVMATKIITIEEPKNHFILKTPAAEVSFPLAKADKQFLAKLRHKLYQLGGVGLAAPQLNCPKQIIAIHIANDAIALRNGIESPISMTVLINPKYEPLTSEMNHDFEACYSVTSKAGKVPRYKKIKVSFNDAAGNFHQHVAEGFHARVLQHEIDHIHGILIIDRLTPDCIQGTQDEMKALRRAELPPHKRALYDQLIAQKTK